jgi:hypothetical protein
MLRPKYSISTESIISLGIITSAALITLLSTIQTRYLFLDETWFVSRHVDVWSALGRPLLHYIMLMTGKVELIFRLDAIYVYRLAGVVLLAGTGALIFRWFRKSGYPRFSAIYYSVGLISLPAFQVIAATSVQLGVALIAALLAAHWIHPLLTGDVTRSDGVVRALGGTILCFVSLCIYQISFLMLFAMLLVPMLQTSRDDIRRHAAFAATYVWLAMITAIYYALWKLIYAAPVDGMNAQYSPHAASLSGVISGLKEFIPGPIHQVANLWYVEDFSASLFFYISVSTVLLAVVRLMYTEGLHGLLKVFVAVGTLLVCDVFRLSAPNHPPTYTTLHPLSTAWWLMLVWSIQSLLGRGILAKSAAAAAGLAGLCIATWTTSVYIAQHNGAQFFAIEQGMRAKPDFASVHIFGATKNFSQLYEYGWTSGADTSYTHSMTSLIAANYFGNTPKISVSHVAAMGDPNINRCTKSDIAIRLPSPDYQCAGLACSFSEEQINRFDWSACKLSDVAD